jgi:hypothetical protein
VVLDFHGHSQPRAGLPVSMDDKPGEIQLHERIGTEFVTHAAEAICARCKRHGASGSALENFDGEAA